MFRRLTAVIGTEAHAIYLASEDPRVPWYAKALAACVLGYFLSPIDLIPDFLPVIGHVDDLIIVPVGLLLAVKLIPAEVMADHRERAHVTALKRKPSWTSATVIAAVWLVLLVLVFGFLRHCIAP